MLPDDKRRAADNFAERYRAIRETEGWATSDGREDPARGPARLWKQRENAVAQAVYEMSTLDRSARRPIVVDVGAGGGWAERYLEGFDVIAIDLIQPPTTQALSVRGDMRMLPIRSGAIDGVLFAASLHYAPVREVISEAARVLRCGGLLVAVDSPMYPNMHAQAAAKKRSADYYAKAGLPELIDSYHPIAVDEFLATMKRSGFDMLNFDAGSPSKGRWRRLIRAAHDSHVVARKVC